MLLTAVQPVSDDSILPPGDTVSRQFDVVVPPAGPHTAVALEVTWHVLYARSPRLTLGTVHRPRFRYSTRANSCHQFEELSWAINQSALVRFTRGAQVLYTWWCADLSGPFIQWSVQAPARPYETERVRGEIMADIAVQHSNRTEVFLLAGA